MLLYSLANELLNEKKKRKNTVILTIYIQVLSPEINTTQHKKNMK